MNADGSRGRRANNAASSSGVRPRRKATGPTRIPPSSRPPLFGMAEPSEDELRQRQAASAGRQEALRHAAMSVASWAVASLLQITCAWVLAHWTVRNSLQPRVAGPLWAVLGAAPAWFSEGMLRRSAMGLRWRVGGCVTGPLRARPGEPDARLEFGLPLLPGAPWFGHPSTRKVCALALGAVLGALDCYISPLAAAVGGTTLSALFLVRAAYASIWICEWRVKQIWRKHK